MSFDTITFVFLTYQCLADISPCSQRLEVTVIVYQLYRGNIQNLKQKEITHSKQIIDY